MNKNSTGVKKRHGRIRMEAAQILVFPQRAISGHRLADPYRRFAGSTSCEAHADELDHITITLQADGTHNVRMVGRYAEAAAVAVEALCLVLDRVTPLAAVSRVCQVINFPTRRFA